MLVKEVLGLGWWEEGKGNGGGWRGKRGWQMNQEGCRGPWMLSCEGPHWRGSLGPRGQAVTQLKLRVPQVLLGHSGLGEFLCDLPCYFLIFLKLPCPTHIWFHPLKLSISSHPESCSVPPKHAMYLWKTEMLFLRPVFLFWHPLSPPSTSFHDIQTPGCAWTPKLCL